MSDTLNLRATLEDLGLIVTQDGEGATAVLRARSERGGPQLSLLPAGDGDWILEHRCRLAARQVQALWREADGNGADAVTLFRRDLTALANAYPLVASRVEEHGEDVGVQFYTPVYAAGLGRQAFVLTASSLLRSAEALDALLKQQGQAVEARSRAQEELQRWEEEVQHRSREQAERWQKELERLEGQRVELQRQAEIRRSAPSAGGSAAGSQAGGADSCSACFAALPAGSRFCALCGAPQGAGAASRRAAPSATAPPGTGAPSAGGRCPNPQCGRTLPPGKQFCTACGARAGAPPA